MDTEETGETEDTLKDRTVYDRKRGVPRERKGDQKWYLDGGKSKEERERKKNYWKGGLEVKINEFKLFDVLLR